MYTTVMDRTKIRTTIGFFVVKVLPVLNTKISEDTYDHFLTEQGYQYQFKIRLYLWWDEDYGWINFWLLYKVTHICRVCHSLWSYHISAVSAYLIITIMSQSQSSASQMLQSVEWQCQNYLWTHLIAIYINSIPSRCNWHIF